MFQLSIPTKWAIKCTAKWPLAKDGKSVTYVTPRQLAVLANDIWTLRPQYVSDCYGWTSSIFWWSIPTKWTIIRTVKWPVGHISSIPPLQQVSVPGDIFEWTPQPRYVSDWCGWTLGMFQWSIPSKWAIKCTAKWPLAKDGKSVTYVTPRQLAVLANDIWTLRPQYASDRYGWTLSMFGWSIPIKWTIVCTAKWSIGHISSISCRICLQNSWHFTIWAGICPRWLRMTIKQ